jgi:urease accessory protein
MEWRVLQLADSAFPTGGFAHSAGLEAAYQQGEVRGLEGLERFVRETLWQAGHGGLPLAAAAHEAASALPRIDALCDAFLSNPVANRASRVQGRAFLSTCVRSIGAGELAELATAARRAGLAQHYAPVFGAVLGRLAIGRDSMQRLFLYFGLRGVVSAAIRLGIVGPYQAQSLQWRLAPELDRVLERCRSLGPEDIAQTAPWLDLLQINHDRLYSRLFQS